MNQAALDSIAKQFDQVKSVKYVLKEDDFKSVQKGSGSANNNIMGPQLHALLNDSKKKNNSNN